MIQEKFIGSLVFSILFFFTINAQTNVTISGMVKDKNSKTYLPYVNVVLISEKDSSFVSGTITNEEGRFSVSNIESGNYLLEISFIGYKTTQLSLFVGNLSKYLDIKTIELEEKSIELQEVLVVGKTA